jgi:hypothetical protein
MFERRAAGVVAVLGVTIFVSPRGALAEEGLDVATDSAYRVDGETGVIHVKTTVVLENTTPDEQTPEGGLKYFYFSGYVMPIPIGATGASVMTATGELLNSRIVFSDNGAFATLDVDFGRQLRLGETIELVVEYDLVGAPARSEDRTRANAAVTSFAVFSHGDPGKTTIRVEVPNGYEINQSGDLMVTSTDAGSTVYTATEIPNPDEWYALFTASNDEHLTSTPLDVGAARFEIRSWPGDAEWAQFVADTVMSGLPTLEQMIGTPWPNETPFAITESLSPYLYGYAGWYDTSANRIELGEDLEPKVALHELAHAWFNDDSFTDRWLNEGLAETYATKAMISLGAAPASDAEVVAPVNEPEIRLADWDVPGDVHGRSTTNDQYGYTASHYVVSAIFDEIGEAELRDVLAAAADGVVPYLGDEQPRWATDTPTDWRRFLDLVQEVGGSQVAEPLIRAWVVRDDQLVMLDQRAAARTAYEALVERDGEWETPLGIRRSMAAWDFGQAEERIASAEQVIAAYQALETTTDALGVAVPGDIQLAYESQLGDQQATLELIEEYSSSAAVLLESKTEVQTERGVIERIGLVQTEALEQHTAALDAFEAGNTQAATASAQSVVSIYESAVGQGRRRAGLSGGLLAGVLGAAALSRVGIRRRRSEIEMPSGFAVETNPTEIAAHEALPLVPLPRYRPTVLMASWTAVTRAPEPPASWGLPVGFAHGYIPPPPGFGPRVGTPARATLPAQPGSPGAFRL